MSDFLDRFGGQLVAASHALSAPPAAEPSRRSRRFRRGVGLGLVAAVVSGSALAATQPWEPTLGRPALNDTPTSTSESGAPADQVALLGVLRRPQSSGDRGVRVQELLRHLGIEQSGVRTSSIRALSSATGQEAVLVSVERAGPVAGVAEPGQANALCVLIENGGFCSTAENLRSGRSLVVAGDHVYALVPDGVAKVVLEYADGQSRSADVRDNFFAVTDAPVSERKIPTPAGTSAPMETPLPHAVKWLDAGGRSVGPPLAK
jgi:hypothetical protein